MLDNYDEETKPLFKLLKTEAFRFVIVRYNHFSFVQQLEIDLIRLFPERPIKKVDAKKLDYTQISNAYFSLENGFFFIENFDNVLKEERDSHNKETPPFVKENQRRRGITAGLNLRRDRLAMYPVALFVFVPATSGELYAKIIMEKMPDLWSFRSWILDLEKNIEKNVVQTSIIKESGDVNLVDDKTLNIDPSQKTELNRLVTLLEKTPESEIAYRLTLYPQIVDAAIEAGEYDKASSILEDWELNAYENDKAEIWFKKGDVDILVGKLESALNLFEKARSLSEKNKDKAYVSVCLERLGTIHSSLGNLDKALEFYQEQNRLFIELYDANPTNVNFKNGLAISYSKLGNTQASLGNIDKALEYYEEQNKLAKELYAAYPTNVEFKNGLAISYEKMGEIQTSIGNLDKALEFYEERNRLGKELYVAYPTNLAFKNGLAVSYSKLGETHTSLGNLDKALEYYEERNRLGKELYTAYPTNVAFKNGLAISYEKLGQTQASLGNLNKALEYYKEQNKLAKELYAAYPTNLAFKNGLAISYEKLGQTQASLGNLDKALEYYEEQNKLAIELYAAYPINLAFKNGLAVSYSKLGETQASLGNLDKALEYYEEDIKLTKELYDAYPTNVEFKNGLAISYAKLGEFCKDNLKNKKRAADYFIQAETLWLELVRDAPQYIDFQKFLGIVQRVIKDLEKD